MAEILSRGGCLLAEYLRKYHPNGPTEEFHNPCWISAKTSRIAKVNIIKSSMILNLPCVLVFDVLWMTAPEAVLLPYLWNILVINSQVFSSIRSLITMINCVLKHPTKMWSYCTFHYFASNQEDAFQCATELLWRHNSYPIGSITDILPLHWVAITDILETYP